MSYLGFDISNWKHGRITSVTLGGEGRSNVVEAATIEVEFVDGRFEEIAVS